MEIIEVLPALRMLRFPVGSAYLWQDGDELTLIDTGTADRAAEIEGALDGALRRIVLTHWHEDHTGSAAELANRHGAEVVAHRLEAPVIRGEAVGAPPVLEQFEVPIKAALPPLPPAPPCRVDHEVEDGDVLAFGGGAVVVAVPGHTDGSIALHLPGPRVVFTGDAVANVGRAMLGVFNTDRVRAMESLRRLAELDVDTAVFGHGEPITRNAASALHGASTAAAT
ncbi:MBL fold metallo-hydrolase [Streptomyces sp. S465]|uniref:MBL fold metallo-hydrolase n=1 Tax=Streptomyces sp. S465 TaxID=2979468 RepID=UPI0022A81F25|nr:MBL fold metallo-hydrolase [Streptomyces sp. S465]WAP60306.1 MBL fold metallo-hydrolase [Streptomyces sp. S465]